MFKTGRLENIGRADPHTLAAFNTLLQELPLIKGTGRSNQDGITIGVAPVFQLQGRDSQKTADQGQGKAPAGNIRSAVCTGRVNTGLIGYDLIRTGIQTVTAEQTFTGMDGGGWGTAALTDLFALFAVTALLLLLADSPDSKAADQSQQCAQGADKPAVKAGANQVGKQGRPENQHDEQAALVQSLLDRSKLEKGVNNRQCKEVKGSCYQGNGIQQANQEQPVCCGQESRTEKDQEEDILQAMQRMRTIQPDFPQSPCVPMANKAAQLVQCPKRTDPAAEEPAKQDGQQHCCQCPEQSPVQGGMGSQNRAQGHQGVKLKKPVHWPALDLIKLAAKGGNQAEPAEQAKKEDLAYAPCLNYPHGLTPFS